MNVYIYLIFTLVNSFILSEAIVSGGSQSTNQTDTNKADSHLTNSFKVNATSPNIETNSTFYYEADTFLLNKDEQQKTVNQPASRGRISALSAPGIEPASIESTSARSGRMLDLDALVGDFAASQSVKARSQTGNRQSRFLNSNSASLEVGNGKKLHIQGFIPIVGVRDITNDESTSIGADSEHENPSSGSRKPNDELPYAQSSIGHASFVSPQQVDAKFSGAGVVDSLRKPLKKLMRYGESGQQMSNNQRNQPAGCLCVPFYMCKNGFISESSLTGSQVQQFIMSQQQYQSAYNQQAQPKAAQMMIAPVSKALDAQAQIALNKAQFATLSAQVDERSLDRDIVTIAPLTRSGDDRPGSFNQTSDSVEPQVSLAASNFEGDSLNSTNELGLTSDYSQEILGRMLGIKSTLGSSKLSQGDSNGATGICGILRTCCNIPAHLVPGGQHQDYQIGGDSNLGSQSQMSFSGSISNPVNRFAVRPFQANQFSQMDAMNQQQSVSQIQKQPQSATSALQRGSPYGLPSVQISRIQPDQFGAMMGTALAHRSNVFPQSGPSVNRFQAIGPSQPGDYKRAPQQMQYVPSNQQAMSSTHHAMIPGDLQSSTNAIRATPGSLYQQNEPLGTRKILEGRCGLRQSAGINGRVQNLQYQENSADFGEYPAQAAILKRLSGSDSMFVCGGTLISQYWIATAAHCIKKHSVSDLKVRLGEWDVHRDDEFYPYVEKGIRDLVVHSEFVAGNLVNDIALLRLDSPIDSSLPHVNPACLPHLDESFTSQKCWVTGWGKDSFGQKGSFQTVLQEVELPVVGQAECESALRQTRLGPHYRLHSGFICAGGEGGKDACEGDGGSGLYCMQDGLIKVAGLVSWGIGCGQPGVPGVYVNLAHYRPWIENIIAIDEDIYSRHWNVSSEGEAEKGSDRENSTLAGVLSDH